MATSPPCACLTTSKALATARYISLYHLVCYDTILNYNNSPRWLCVCLFGQYTMSRGVVHACHAGGVVHYLEGWTHHEVGALDVDRIDLVWEAALKHGLKPVSSK